MIEQQIVKEIVDEKTGECLRYESTKKVRRKVDSENFYMVFFDYLQVFPSLKKSGINNIVLQQLCKRAGFDNGMVTLATGTREEICIEADISNNQLTNALKALKEDNLISVVKKGIYKVNPEIFWRGDQKIRRAELLKNKELQVTYEIVDSDESDIN